MASFRLLTSLGMLGRVKVIVDAVNAIVAESGALIPGRFGTAAMLLPPYPRLQMYVRLRVLAVVTPFAEPDISSKAIGGLYFLAKWI